MGVQLERYMGKDRICNYCDRFKRSEPVDVRFYDIHSDMTEARTIMRICEYCANQLLDVLSDELDIDCESH